jgi:hypothetical protein
MLISAHFNKKKIGSCLAEQVILVLFPLIAICYSATSLLLFAIAIPLLFWILQYTSRYSLLLLPLKPV